MENSTQESCLYAVYLLKGEILNSTCVMRQIRKNERTVNEELWYRKSKAEGLAYKDLVPGMNIEFWWPYKGQDDDGIESNGRFRKARVLKTTKPRPKSSKSGLETCLREDLGVSSAVFMKSDWENSVHRSFLRVAGMEPSVKMKTESAEKLKLKRKRLEDLQEKKTKIMQDIVSKKKSLSIAMAKANSHGVTFEDQTGRS